MRLSRAGSGVDPTPVGADGHSASMRCRYLLAALNGVALAAGCGVGSHGAKPFHGAKSREMPRARLVARSAKHVVRLADRAVGLLSTAVQDAAGARIGKKGFVLLGGLNAADTSTNRIRAVTGAAERARGALPRPIHDAAAVSLRGVTYLFGGGDGNEQVDDILRVDPTTGRTNLAAHLPAPCSD